MLMLILFKQWRAPNDLKDGEKSWNSAFEKWYSSNQKPVGEDIKNAIRNIDFLHKVIYLFIVYRAWKETRNTVKCLEK